ncbi:hypothetical protein [Halosegnis longus]|uniref:hypothetical protein n=1 Tax=Halosegnis longus TaxID=2216012 RepID=UPI00129E5068|nr:hypothetical protein [Halosegnis longus]
MAQRAQLQSQAVYVTVSVELGCPSDAFPDAMIAETMTVDGRPIVTVELDAKGAPALDGEDSASSALKIVQSRLELANMASARLESVQVFTGGTRVCHEQRQGSDEQVSIDR